MKTTIPKLKRMIRKVIREHVGDEHHEHGEGSHEEEPYDGYVEAMALAHVEEQAGGLDFDEYAEFAAQYGYTSEADLDQLEEWWEAAIAQHRGYPSEASFGDGYAPRERRNPYHPDTPFGLHADDYPIGMGRPLKESMSPQHPYYDMVAEVIMRVSRDVMFGHISGRDAIYNECVIQADENEVGTHIDYIFEKVMARVQAMGM